VGGSGFGAAKDVWPYLIGDWSIKGYGWQPMPFDGFLFTSHIIVAKEVHTSSLVKNLIVAASGMDDAVWEGTYWTHRQYSHSLFQAGQAHSQSCHVGS
jgi:fatty acid synthase subunit beta